MRRVAENVGENPSIHVVVSAPEQTDFSSVVLFVHGFGEHIGRYTELETRVVQNGLPVIRFDLRGHGLSSGRRGHVNDYSEYCDDLDAALRFAFTSPLSPLVGKQPLPIHAFCHSNGGLVATSWLITRGAASPYRLPTLFMTSPFFGLPGMAGRLPRAFARRTVAFLSCFTATLPPIPPKHLSRDKNVGDTYSKDMLVVPAPPTSFVGAAITASGKVATPEGAAALKKLGVKVRVVAGGADGVVSVPAIRALVKQWEKGGVDVKFSEYEGAYHELHNEIEPTKAKLFGEIDSWLGVSTA